MIYLEIQGNLGNQLFQYAFAKRIASLTGQKICLNLYNFNKGRPDLKFSLCDYTLIDNVVVDTKKKLPFYADSFSMFSRIAKKLAPKAHSKLLKKLGVFFWQGEGSRSDFFENIPIKKDYYIAGWFQAAEYYSDMQDILKNDLIPRNDPPIENSELYKIITETDSVCVSIRRGDYVSNPKFNKMYFVCNESYFDRAIKKIKEEVEKPTFIFFSDDIEWVRNNIDAPEGSYYESGRDSTCEKLRLMSGCKHYIVSNSSFSWWAQYLGKRKDSIIVAPSRWSAKEEKPSEIYEKNWVLIDV